MKLAGFGVTDPASIDAVIAAIRTRDDEVFYGVLASVGVDERRVRESALEVVAGLVAAALTA